MLHAVPVSAADGLATCASGAGPRAPVPVPKDLEADIAGLLITNAAMVAEKPKKDAPRPPCRPEEWTIDRTDHDITAQGVAQPDGLGSGAL